MIKIINGDVTEAKENVIIHQVNCQGKMGSGVALAIKNKFPEAYDKYMYACNKYSPNFLLCNVVTAKGNGYKKIYNCFNQLNYGYDGKLYTDYRAFFETFLRVLDESKCDIAMPYKMGCDRGGADWDNIIYPFIKGCSLAFPYDIVMYKL